MVLPLPLTAIEHYMLADDSADYPMRFALRLRFAKPLEEGPLRRAGEIAARRHPLLEAVLECEGDRPRRWVRAPRGADTAAQDEGRPAAEGFDLKQAPGLRFLRERTGAGETLTIEFHHACTDGMGAVQYVNDLLRAYAQLSAGADEPELPPCEPERLARRDSFGLNGWRRPLRVLYGAIGWLGVLEFFAHRPRTIGGAAASTSETEPSEEGRLHGELSASQTAALLAEARRKRATLNDLLLRDLFLAVGEFNALHAPGDRRTCTRIMVPVNLRLPDDARTPAANLVAMIQLDRRVDRPRSAERLLRGLHWEMSLVKRMRLGLTFIQVLRLMLAVRGDLRPLLPRDRCLATCVLSNLGRGMEACPEAGLEGVEFYPPIRPRTRAAVGVLSFEGRLSVSLQYDRAALDESQGRQLLEGFLRRLNGSSAADAPTAETASGPPHA